MPAWQITKKWTSKEIGEYRAYAAAQVPKRVGNQRCTCEDLSLRVVTDFAAANGLPVAIVNDTYPRRKYTRPVNPLRPDLVNDLGVASKIIQGYTTQLAYRHGLTPEDFKTKSDFDTKTLTTTGASDLITHKMAKLVPGAVVAKADSLTLAREGDLILHGQRGSHVQVVTGWGAGLVKIMQGNFRPDEERASGWDTFWGVVNQNDPTEDQYIGEIVAEHEYKRDAAGVWWYRGKKMDFTAVYGRVMIWDFAAWNDLVVERVVQPNETLSSIALTQWGHGNAWNRVYGTNAGAIGTNPDRVRPGTRLFLWK